MFRCLLKPLSASFCEKSSFKYRNYVSSYSTVKLAFNSYESIEKSDKEPLIIMHGLFGSKNNWNSLCKQINAITKRTVYSLDSRNHGESPHTAEHSYELMGEDVAQFMKDQGIETAAVLGHSMGGRVMMRLALKYPQLVERAVIVDISPVSKIGTTQSDIPLFLDAMRSINIHKEHTIHQGRTEANEQLKPIVPEQSLRDFLITNLSKADNGDFIWRINLESLSKNFEKHIVNFPLSEGMQYQGPTLFIGGGNSDYLKKLDLLKITKLFPHCDLKYIAGAGHWVHAEKPKDFLKLVLDFLNK